MIEANGHWIDVCCSARNIVNMCVWSSTLRQGNSLDNQLALAGPMWIDIYDVSIDTARELAVGSALDIPLWI